MRKPQGGRGDRRLSRSLRELWTRRPRAGHTTNARRGNSVARDKNTRWSRSGRRILGDQIEFGLLTLSAFLLQILDLDHEIFTARIASPAISSPPGADERPLRDAGQRADECQAESALRFHRIDWENASLGQDVRDQRLGRIRRSPWQFSIRTNEHGRVHGFLIHNVFYSSGSTRSIGSTRQARRFAVAA